jgi:hypothetical protein
MLPLPSIRPAAIMKPLTAVGLRVLTKSATVMKLNGISQNADPKMSVNVENVVFHG